MTATTPPPLLLERNGAIATLRFNRPGALNAIDVPMATALRDAVRSLAQDDSVRCVVLCGAGKGFMAGGDLATLRADPVQGARDLLAPLNEAVALLAQLNAPVIAQVHGVAAGAGLSLMLQADFVLAAEGTRFNLAYINLGTSCDVGASWALPRLVGLRRALEIAMLGDTYSASEAERLGLVNRVVPAGDTLPQALALARTVAERSPVATRLLKKALVGQSAALAAAMETERQNAMSCFANPDTAARIAASLPGKG